MKTARVWVAAVVMAGFGLQGCASSGGTQQGAAEGSIGSSTGPTSTLAAAPGSTKTVVNADTKAKFEATVAAVRQQMQPGGRWQFVDDGQRAVVNGTFADMGRIFDQYGSVDKMDPGSRERLLVDQSKVNAILTQTDGLRVICWNEIRVGTHFPVRTCKTYAQLQMEHQATQEGLRRLQQLNPRVSPAPRDH
ncbi:MAG TPA: hypothetical protein VFY97_11975 [Rhodanobacteraceae bacterium]|nr:hypothetical protein [Rhodanobacteraceae bacterium]